MTSAISDPLFVVDGTELGQDAKLVLTGTSGSISASKWIATATNGGQVVIDGGDYVSLDEAFKAIGTDSIVVFNDGSISAVTCGIGVDEGATVEMNGGVIETSDGMGLGTNDPYGDGGNTITMSGGSIEANVSTSGNEAVGVYIANNDAFTMDGGEIVANGGTGICMRAGTVTINDGTITATGTDKNGDAVSDGYIGDEETVMTGVSAIIYHESADYPANEGMSLTVTGGTITGVDHAIQVLSSENEPNVTVTGGTFQPAYPEEQAEPEEQGEPEQQNP